MSKAYTLHSEVVIDGLLAADYTTPKGDLIWIGDVVAGKWVTAGTAIQYAESITKVAQAQMARAAFEMHKAVNFMNYSKRP